AHDLARDGGVLVHVHAQVDALGTETKGAADGHGGVDAEAARLVGGRRHHASAARIRAHDDGAATDLGPVALLDGRVGRVHVHLDDGPEGGRRAHGPDYEAGPPRPMLGATAVRAPITKPICSSRSTPSSSAPRYTSCRFTVRAKPLSLSFFFTEAGSSPTMARPGRTRAQAVTKPDSSSQA